MHPCGFIAANAQNKSLFATFRMPFISKHPRIFGDEFFITQKTIKKLFITPVVSEEKVFVEDIQGK